MSFVNVYVILQLYNVDYKVLQSKDQLLLDGFRYRRANKSQSIWRCCKNNCARRVRFDGFQYVPVTGHNHIAIIYCSHEAQLSVYRPLLADQGRGEKLATGKSTSMKTAEKLKLEENTRTIGTWNIQNTMGNWTTRGAQKQDEDIQVRYSRCLRSTLDRER